MPVVVGLENIPIFESFVDCFLSVSNTLLHALLALFIVEAFWTLAVLWCLSNVIVISFHTFTRLKMRQKRVSKNKNSWPHAALARTVYPHNVTSEDAQSNLAPQS